jgi:N-acyl-D-amino-acid deacylase
MDLDLVMSNARVVDGTGAPWFRADVGLEDGRVAVVGRLADAHAARRIEADDRVLCPGWIDIHTHSDFGVIADPAAECAVRQGSTTHVIGNCGVSAAPIADETRELAVRQLGTYGHELPAEWSDYSGYLAAVERRGVGTNIAPLVGHGTVRLAVLGMQERPPTPEELDRMRSHVDEAMRAGCFGMSTGLVYPPGCFGSTDEVVALAEVVASYGGFYASHIRGERETIVEAVTECISIGERSGCRVQISHNCPKFGGWHLQDQVIALWEEARARGLDVTVDNDLHTDFGPSLGEALPQWTFGLSTDELMRLLRDPERRAALKEEIRLDERPAFGPAGLLVHEAFHRIFVLRSPAHPERDGMTIAAIAETTGADPWDAFFDQIVDDSNATMAVFDYMTLEHIERMLRHPLVMVSSDGWVIPPDARTGTSDGDPAPYVPCSYAEYPGLIQRYVVERPVLTLEEAVRKSTSMPAAKVGLHDRGVIRPGAWADLLVFDPARVRDRATDLWPHDSGFPTYPHEYPEGIDWVVVNGQIAVEEGEFLGAKAGRVLRRGT